MKKEMEQVAKISLREQDWGDFSNLRDSVRLSVENEFQSMIVVI